MVRLLAESVRAGGFHLRSNLFRDISGSVGKFRIPGLGHNTPDGLLGFQVIVAGLDVSRCLMVSPARALVDDINIGEVRLSPTVANTTPDVFRPIIRTEIIF